ncbi:transposase, partial [Facklamia sp. P13064]|uniref:transposase n=1 Tax=Facklamia sp. P13064 TaxID=3421953 RepID=UPI003D16FE95
TYPKLAEQLRLKKNLFSFVHFPKEILTSFYINKQSEAVNKQIKRITTIKEQFPHEASLGKTVYCYISEYNAKFGQRIHKGFGKVTFELRNLLDQRRPINDTKLREGITKLQVF